MGFIKTVLGKEESLEEQIRANPTGLSDEYSTADTEYTSPQTVQQYLTLSGLPIGIIEEEMYSDEHSKPSILNEAIALNESLHNQAEEVENPTELGQEIFQEVMEKGAREDLNQLLEEDEKGLHRLEERGHKKITDQYAVPESEGGSAEPFRYTFQNGTWTPVEELDKDHTKGVEVIRKSNWERGGKRPSKNPEKMWRLRETEFEKQNGEWTAPLWREDPTYETQITHDAAETVVNSYREQYPSLELTLFGSCSEGTMTNSSDLEHSLHIDAEDIGLEDNRETHAVYHEAWDAAERIRDDLLEDIIQETERNNVEGLEPGYGYIAIRDDQTEYELNRRQRVPHDDFRFVAGEEADTAEFNQHRENIGLKPVRPKQFYDLPKRSAIKDSEKSSLKQKITV